MSYHAPLANQPPGQVLCVCGRDWPHAEFCDCLAAECEQDPHLASAHTDCGGYAADRGHCGGCDSCVSAKIGYYHRTDTSPSTAAAPAGAVSPSSAPTSAPGADGASPMAPS